MSELQVAEKPAFSVSENAAKRIKEIIAQDGGADLMLRIAVSGGGCSGFQYGFTLDDTLTPDDEVLERDGARVVIDSVSVQYMKGSQIDFVEDLVGASFQINNPNATSKCGCGTSFAV